MVSQLRWGLPLAAIYYAYRIYRETNKKQTGKIIDADTVSDSPRRTSTGTDVYNLAIRLDDSDHQAISRFVSLSPEHARSTPTRVKLSEKKARRRIDHKKVTGGPHSFQCGPECRLQSVPWHRKCVVILVGLPCRGKSHISQKLINFMRWQGIQAALFNVGNARRDGGDSEARVQQGSFDADFFSPDNKEAVQIRENLALSVLQRMLMYLMNGGDVGVFDATNSTRERRRLVKRLCEEASPILNVLFVECICDDPRIIEANMKFKCSQSPDYRDMPLDRAVKVTI